MRNNMKNSLRAILASTIVATLSVSCAVGPDYVRPAAEKPSAFKESLHWKQAEPKDTAIRGQWWELFNDATLNGLEEQIAVSNQNVKTAEAQFRQARALIAEARAAYFPILSGNVSESRNSVGAGSASSTHSGGTYNTYNVSLDASWEPDLWGRVRRTVEANEASAQASAADLASVQLSAQANLATAYLSLRVADEQKRLLDDTVKAYRKFLELTQNLYNSGVDARSDVLQASVQLKTTEAQAIDVGVQRAQYEHAIAILIGKAPADFSLEAVNNVPQVPAIPLGLPSELLERRPDIAGSERRVAAANAEIGVAKAAFFPDLTLAASGGYQSSTLSNWISLPNRVWSIGPSLVETLFDAGLRSAQSEAAIASYDQAVATYRQTVLGGFQEVEDNLAALRILEEESAKRQSAVKDSEDAVTINLNQYKAGTISYLNVATAQAVELNNKLAALTVENQRLTAAATLIKALGGGWQQTELDKPAITTPKSTPFSFFPAVLPMSTSDTPQATPIPITPATDTNARVQLATPAAAASTP